MINNRAAGDSRFALTGKNGAIYNGDGVLLATVDSFVAQINFTNGKYKVLGDAQDHETAQDYSVTLVITHFVVEDDQMIRDVMSSLETLSFPQWDFQGTLTGRNGSEERMVYRDCMPSGQIDLQNVTVGEPVKRTINLFVNRPPKLQNMLSMG